MPPLLAIVGVTASGKSTLAMDLARRFNGEIVCADSWTVYRGFDIGTAKPTADDRTEIPHHLLDVADPSEGFSAALFKELAGLAVRDISRRGRLPILVGGTGLYVDSLLYDYSFLPPSDPEYRTKLNAMDLEQLLVLANKLELGTDSIDQRNKRRVIRLIENNGRLPTRRNIRKNTLLLGAASDPSELRLRVIQRINGMIRQGLEREVSGLVVRYGWNVEPMKGIGYREWRNYFAGMQSIVETEDQIISSTMGLAKRQRTWLKRNGDINWSSERSYFEDVLTTFLNKTN